MDAQKLKDCFLDTIARSREGELAAAAQRAIHSGMVIRENFRSARLFSVENTQIAVLPAAALDAAVRLLPCGRTAVLNFANPHYPGGGNRYGTMNREASLCRRSNLYVCLEDARFGEDFYRYHREKTDYFFSDRLIYLRDVTVFKDQSPVPGLLDPEDWFSVDVISCAAPFLGNRKYTNPLVLTRLFQNRIRNILEAAIDNEVKVLILGAFGCGAFCNPPRMVARAFYDVLRESRYRGAFRRIVFAIPCGGDEPADEESLTIFRDVFSGNSLEIQALPEKITLPGGRVLRQEREIQSFLDWRRSNPRYGRQFSILGDAISTLEGFNPRGYPVFYRDAVCEKTGITDMEDTWWGKVIDFFGGQLLVNNAMSGSKVTAAPGAEDPFPAGCSARRTGQLHMRTVMPDVIVLYLGLNDWYGGAVLDAAADSDPKVRLTGFRAAYRHMLGSIRKQYPDAEIWCCTLCETHLQGKERFVFPSAYGGVELRHYNEVIRETARLGAAKLLDLHACGLPYESVDGIHPTAAGMNTLAALLIHAADEDAGRYLDCSGGNHDNLEIQGEDGAFRYICKRCGRVHRAESGGVGLRIGLEEMLRTKSKPVLTLLRQETGESICLSGDTIFAGRSADCDLRLHSPYAARYQAEFSHQSGAWYVQDNDSKNGTYVNGARLEPGEPHLLQAGDVISFAKTDHVVYQQKT